MDRVTLMLDRVTQVGGAEELLHLHTLLNSRRRHMRSGKPMDLSSILADQIHGGQPMDRPIVPADEIDDIQIEQRRSRKLKTVSFKPDSWVFFAQSDCLGNVEDSIREPGPFDKVRNFMWSQATAGWAAGLCGRSHSSSNRNTSKSLLFPTAAATGATAAAAAATAATRPEAGAGSFAQSFDAVVEPARDVTYVDRDVTDIVHETVVVAHDAREWPESGHEVYRC